MTQLGISIAGVLPPGLLVLLGMCLDPPVDSISVHQSQAWCLVLMQLWQAVIRCTQDADKGMPARAHLQAGALALITSTPISMLLGMCRNLSVHTVCATVAALAGGYMLYKRHRQGHALPMTSYLAGASTNAAERLRTAGGCLAGACCVKPCTGGGSGSWSRVGDDAELSTEPGLPVQPSAGASVSMLRTQGKAARAWMCRTSHQLSMPYKGRSVLCETQQWCWQQKLEPCWGG